MEPNSKPKCVACGNSLTDGNPHACGQCRRRYPPSLINSAVESSFYLLTLTTGESYRFGRSAILGEYATIYEGENDHEPDEGELIPGRRGTDVRVSEIVTCADMGH